MGIAVNGYRGLRLLVDIGGDRFLYVLAVIVGLSGGTLIGLELQELRGPVYQQTP